VVHWQSQKLLASVGAEHGSHISQTASARFVDVSSERRLPVSRRNPENSPSTYRVARTWNSTSPTGEGMSRKLFVAYAAAWLPSKRSYVNKKLFAELVESMERMNEIARGERAPSRKFHIEPLAVQAPPEPSIEREASGLEILADQRPPETAS
jgi:hypothetical protein